MCFGADREPARKQSRYIDGYSTFGLELSLYWTMGAFGRLDDLSVCILRALDLFAASVIFKLSRPGGNIYSCLL